MPAAAASWANTERLIGCGAFLEGLAWWRGWERVRFGSVFVADGGADVDAGRQGEPVGLQHSEETREGREGHAREGRQRQVTGPTRRGSLVVVPFLRVLLGGEGGRGFGLDQCSWLMAAPM